eukprot:gene7458-8727_t
MELRGHEDNIEQLKWSPVHPDILATASSDKTVRIWDTKRENINLSWYFDGSMIAVGNKEDHVSLIDVAKAKVTRTYKYPYEINEIIWDTKGELFFLTTGTGMIDVMKWLPKTNEYVPLKSITAHTSNLYTIEMDPTKKYFAIGAADSNVSLWDIEEMMCLRSYGKLSQPVRTMGFSFDGQFIAYSSDEPFIEIAHVESGQSIFQINLDCGLNSISWHPTLPMLAYACNDENENSKNVGVVKVFGFHSSK